MTADFGSRFENSLFPAEFIAPQFDEIRITNVSVRLEQGSLLQRNLLQYETLERAGRTGKGLLNVAIGDLLSFFTEIPGTTLQKRLQFLRAVFSSVVLQVR